MTQHGGAPTADSLIASLIFAVIVVDENDCVREANPAAETMLGRSARRLSGKPLEDYLVIHEKRVSESLFRGEARLIARGIGVRAGETERRVNLTSSPLPNCPGWRVVTLSEAPNEAGEEDERLELRAPSVLAHEIKNPLSAIRGASQLLSRRIEIKHRPLAKLIATEVDRIAGLIDRMQQLGSSAEVSVVPCNLHESIRNAMTSIRAGRGGAVDMIEEFDPSLPKVLADPDALEQVLINLLANAWDASADKEGAAIIVRTRFASGLIFNAIRFGKAVRLPIEVCVIDSGSGIDPDLRDHVFEPFVTTKRQGQGLGLALVRKLVRDMGGRIAHERDERAGQTTFRINLAVAGGEG